MKISLGEFLPRAAYAMVLNRCTKLAFGKILKLARHWIDRFRMFKSQAFYLSCYESSEDRSSVSALGVSTALTRNVGKEGLGFLWFYSSSGTA